MLIQTVKHSAHIWCYYDILIIKDKNCTLGKGIGKDFSDFQAVGLFFFLF